MPKRVIFHHLEIYANGEVWVELHKQIVEEGQVIFTDPHRALVAPDMDATKRLEQVNQHFESMDPITWPRVSQGDLEEISSHLKLAHSPEKVSAFKSHKEAQERRAAKKIADDINMAAAAAAQAFPVVPDKERPAPSSSPNSGAKEKTQ